MDAKPFPIQREPQLVASEDRLAPSLPLTSTALTPPVVSDQETLVDRSALILAPFSQSALETLRRTLSVTYESWTDTRRLYSPEELWHRINADNIGVLVVEADFLFAEVFQNSSPLKFLGVCRNGLDHIDVQAATEHRVAVVNTPGRNAQGVAELTICLMLALARDLPNLNGYVKDGAWESPAEPYITNRGVELSGKTLGIIGLGTIGSTVARLANGLGMNVLAYDPHVAISDGKSGGAHKETLENVLRLSDFVSVHTTNGPDTEGLLDRGRLSLLKPGSYIINTAAYSVIEEGALVEYLKSGHIAGAALDVHRTHPIHPTSPFLGLKNVILTPHIGGATDGTVERQSNIMVEEIFRFLNGLRPRRLVNREVWRRLG